MEWDFKGKNNFYFAILEVTTRVKVFEKKMIKQSGLEITPKMLSYIALIEDNPHISHAELLNFLDITKGALSNMIKLLIDKKFLTKKHDKKDKRKVDLMLTKQGVKVAKLNDEIRTRIKKHIMKKLTPQEIEMLISIAIKLNK